MQIATARTPSIAAAPISGPDGKLQNRAPLQELGSSIHHSRENLKCSISGKGDILWKEDDGLTKMLNDLSDEQVEIAARASYNYLQNPSEDMRHQCAKQYAQRFLRSKRGDTEKALQRLRETLAFRDELDVDGLRKAFDGSENSVSEPLKKHLSSGSVYVASFDKVWHR
jgi:hypothetical protein